MENLKIALAQIQGNTQPEKNIKKAQEYIEKAVEQQAKLIVFPEMFMALPKINSPPSDYAAVSDTFTAKLAQLAKNYEIAICAGVWEKSPELQKVYNTAVIFAADGSLLASYRKLHLFDAMAVKESELMLAGMELPPLFSLAGFTIGLGICYDLRFPEHFRYLSAKGAEIILLPAAWYSGAMKEEMWLTLLKARAMENVCYMGGAVLTGRNFIGRSAAFDPFGVPLGDAGEQETLITFIASKERLQEVRARLPVLEHRRSDLFGE